MKKVMKKDSNYLKNSTKIYQLNSKVLKKKWKIQNRIHGHHEDDEHQYRSDHVEEQMDKGRPLCILLTGQGSQQRRGTGTDIAAQDDEETDVHVLEQSLLRHQKG